MPRRAHLPTDAVGGVVVAHRLLRLHPRPAGDRPSRPVEESRLEAQLPRRLQGGAQTRPPLVAPELAVPELDSLPRIVPTCAGADVGCEEEARNADLLHPFEVFADALFVHALVDPVVVAPQRHRLRRGLESGSKPRERRRRFAGSGTRRRNGAEQCENMHFHADIISHSARPRHPSIGIVFMVLILSLKMARLSPS